MLYQVTKLRGDGIGALDGEIGSVEDVYFDDERWGVRNWLPGGQLLVPPDAVAGIDWSTRSVRLKITREEVKHSPELP